MKLLQLKNPWSHLRWKGHYSELDAVHWTPHLQQTLNYDPHMAEKVDNGIFWIDYNSICNFFDVFYLNWDPTLFQYTYCIHQYVAFENTNLLIIMFASNFINFCLMIFRKWHAGVGPTKDAYSIGDNPQYSLRVPAGRGSVWVLLTRHITNIDDFRDNKEYITLLVYQNSGKRIYYPCK